MSFEFELQQPVGLIESDEEGQIVARAEYVNQDNCYLVRYKAADGRQVESWWSEDAIKRA